MNTNCSFGTWPGRYIAVDFSSVVAVTTVALRGIPLYSTPSVIRSLIDHSIRTKKIFVRRVYQGPLLDIMVINSQLSGGERVALKSLLPCTSSEDAPKA